MKRLPTPAASGKSHLTLDGAYRPTDKCCVAHVLGACSCSQHPCAFAAHAERSHEQPVSCPISYKTKKFDDINLSLALVQRYESDTDFFKAHENAQTSLDRACDILYFVLFLAARF